MMQPKLNQFNGFAHVGSYKTFNNLNVVSSGSKLFTVNSMNRLQLTAQFTTSVKSVARTATGYVVLTESELLYMDASFKTVYKLQI